MGLALPVYLRVPRPSPAMAATPRGLLGNPTNSLEEKGQASCSQTSRGRDQCHILPQDSWVPAPPSHLPTLPHHSLRREGAAGVQLSL